MLKIAAIGDRDSVSGFASLGLEVFTVEEPSQALHTLRRMIDSDCAVIFITELLAVELEAEIDRYKDKPLPAIIPIPGVKGNTGLGMRNVSKSIEKAVGSDILEN